jgi:hypothetical protein
LIPDLPDIATFSLLSFALTTVWSTYIWYTVHDVSTRDTIPASSNCLLSCPGFRKLNCIKIMEFLQEGCNLTIS